MNQGAIEYNARKFFPHLGLRYGVLCVMEVLLRHGILRRVKDSKDGRDAK